MASSSNTAQSRLSQVTDFLTGKKTATSIPWDPDCTQFPTRKHVPRREGAPAESAWVWGENDYIGRLNLLTPTRVTQAAKQIKTGEIVPLNLPLDVPEQPAFARETFQHEIKPLAPGLAYDDKYTLNTQSGTQWDGFRHIAHMPSAQFYNGTTGDDVDGPNRNHKCSIHHWAEHGIAGRGVLLDYWSYAKQNGIVYGRRRARLYWVYPETDYFVDPFEYYTIPYTELEACGKAQGIDIRPASAGGDIQIGDMLFIRSGFVSTYYTSAPDVRAAAALRPHTLGKDDGQRWAGIKQEEKMIDWLHDCYFSAVAGDAPSFEAWPSQQEYMLHEYILALWGEDLFLTASKAKLTSKLGMPLGEMFDLEKLARTCKEKGRYTFFVTSSPSNCKGGVSSHGNSLAIF
ncbi:hypothetical protein BP6252_13459 [Coleophoma cylindrospora]|uniref:Uncharacterized protein n=1 Tax=Coleophoma cylindrospora TaxID=1849047 RepID=A0A3D8Q8T8_9HELO|nr:hypothetical protein BP6252_13459 [Coleophoma cylindrospora]